MNVMLLTLLGFTRSELGVSSSTINIVLTVSTLTVVALPLLFVFRSQGGPITSRKITL